MAIERNWPLDYDLKGYWLDKLLLHQRHDYPAELVAPLVDIFPENSDAERIWAITDSWAVTERDTGNLSGSVGAI